MAPDCHYKAGFVVCLLALASGGCRKNVDPLQGSGVDAGSDLSVRRPLVVSWAGTRGSVAGGAESISLYGVKTRYSVTLINFAAGTEVCSRT